MGDGRAIVEKALNQLRLTVTPEDARNFSDTRLEDVWREAREIEREQGARLALRNMRRIEPFLKSLETYSGVIDTFCQGFSPMAWVWVSMRHTGSRCVCAMLRDIGPHQDDASCKYTLCLCM